MKNKFSSLIYTRRIKNKMPKEWQSVSKEKNVLGVKISQWEICITMKIWRTKATILKNENESMRFKL